MRGSKGESRIHTESELRGYLTWCQVRTLNPHAATRLALQAIPDQEWLTANTKNQPMTATSFGPFSWQRVIQ